MKEELKVFENRSDDWLAKERAYEARISAWDLDDGRKLKEEHREIHKQKDIVKQNFNNFERNRNVNKKGSSKKIEVTIIRIVLLIMAFGFITPFLFIFLGNTVYFYEIFEALPAVVFVILIIITSNVANSAKKGR